MYYIIEYKVVWIDSKGTKKGWKKGYDKKEGTKKEKEDLFIFIFQRSIYCNPKTRTNETVVEVSL